MYLFYSDGFPVGLLLLVVSFDNSLKLTLPLLIFHCIIMFVIVFCCLRISVNDTKRVVNLSYRNLG